jgi:hypothetical protein
VPGEFSLISPGTKMPGQVSLWIIQVLVLDPKAPASEPKMAAKAVMVPGLIEIRPGVIS